MNAKPKSTLSLIAASLLAIVFNFIMGAVAGLMLGVNPLATATGLVSLSFAFDALKITTGAQTGFNGFLAGLAREMYLAELLQKYRANPQWLSRARDLSGYVVNVGGVDVINLAEAGADPDIIVDYDHIDPLPVADDEDKPLIIPLRSFSTTRSKITATQNDSRAYSIMADRMARHAATQGENVLNYAAFAFAPTTHSSDTPIIETTGGAIGGYKVPKLNDLVDLRTSIRKTNATGNIILVLSDDDFGHLQKEDKELFKSYLPESPEQGFSLLGMTAYVSNVAPRYSLAGDDYTIKAWNSAVEDTDHYATFAFIENEVGRAQGVIKPYFNNDDSAYQASFFSTRNRFIAHKMRNKGVAALVRANG